jgi:hypothetical protein
MGREPTSDAIFLGFAPCFLMLGLAVPVADGGVGVTDQLIRLVIGSSRLGRKQ